MLRLTFSLLLVGLAAVSTLPVNETFSELISSKIPTKTITLEDVENDEGVEIMRATLSVCSMENPESQRTRKIREDALKEVMESKNFSAFTDEFLQNITATRKTECPPGSDPNQFTGRNSNSYIMLATATFNGTKPQKSSENYQELSANQRTQESQQDHSEPNHLCESNFFEKDGQYYPGFGAPCHDDTGCAQKNLTCLQGQCGCDGRYDPLSRICLKWPRELHDSCDETRRCDRIENSFCLLDGRCGCGKNYFEQNGRCVPIPAESDRIEKRPANSIDESFYL